MMQLFMLFLLLKHKPVLPLSLPKREVMLLNPLLKLLNRSHHLLVPQPRRSLQLHPVAEAVKEKEREKGRVELVQALVNHLINLNLQSL